MEQATGWIAPIMTVLAAMLTAANLGPRITGGGFVVFSLGSVAWIVFGVASDQPNLIWQNVVLTAINLFGVWRWLGREARWQSGAKAAAGRSRADDRAELCPASLLIGQPLRGADGGTIGEGVDAMIDCEGGDIRWLVVREGGAGSGGAKLHRIESEDFRLSAKGASTRLSANALRERPVLTDDDWTHSHPAGKDAA